MTTINLAGADPRVVTEVTDTLRDLTAAWPGIEPVSIGLADLDAETMAQTDMTTGEVTLSRTCATDWATMHKDVLSGIRSHTLHKGISREPARYALTHEYGHVLAIHLGLWNSLGCDDKVEAALRATVGDAFKVLDPDNADYIDPDAVPVAWGLGLYTYDILTDLSGYASATPMEFIAEGFAVRTICGPGTSKAADAIYESMRRAYEVSRFNQGEAA